MAYADTVTTASQGFSGAWNTLMDKMKEMNNCKDPNRAKELEIEMKQMEQIFKSIDAALNSLLNAEATMAQSPRG